MPFPSVSEMRQQSVLYVLGDITQPSGVVQQILSVQEHVQAPRSADWLISYLKLLHIYTAKLPGKWVRKDWGKELKWALT